ncbi:MAG: hypothetical protein RXR31_03500 [Thermoproteota archaeon]|jgi:hypothetical protein
MRDKILLDTVYLLPIFSIDIGINEIDVLFQKILESYDVYYNPISLIEAKLIILKLMKKDKGNREEYLKSFIKGLRTILKDERLKQTEITNAAIEEYADNLVGEIKNYFRRTIYATAKYINALLLTESKILLNYNNTSNIIRLYENEKLAKVEQVK